MSTSTTVTEGDNANVSLGNGNYTVDAGNNDVIKVGNGSDRVTGGTGDTVSVGNGNDTVSLGSESSITAGNGNDTLTAGDGSSIRAGNGTDAITAGNDSSVQAGNGNDTITVGSDSTVKAGNGNDTIQAGSHSVVVAGNGNDTIYMGASDTVTVGNGTDKFILQPTGSLSLTAPNSLTLNEDTSVSFNLNVALSGLGFGQEIIYGFSAASDQLVFNTAQFANAGAVLASASQVGQNTVITADAADTVTLENVKLSSLSAKDFAFVSGGPAPNVQITISGLPAGVTLSDNSGPLQIVNGSITLTPAQLAGLTLSANDAGSATLTITAINTVTGASISKQISLTVNEMAAAPNLSAPQALSVNEGGTIALGISTSAVEADQNAPSILISGVPADAMLSAGINNHNGTWTLTAAQLTGLQFTAGEEGNATLTVTATDTEVASTASATRSISLTINPPTINVMLAGTAQEGAVLTANAIVSNGDAVAFQWQSSADGHNWTPISGATSQTYTVQEVDENSQIRAIATLVDDGYSVASAATLKVADAAPAFASGPTISGTAQEGQTLTASATPTQSDNTVTYQWQANGTNISGATAATYVVQEGDEGKTIDVVATITNENKLTVSATSIATGAVLDAAPTITTPIISGTAQEGHTLSASASSGQSDNPVSYAWYSSVDGYTNSIGTGATYQVKEGDEGFTIEVKAAATNDNGVKVSATSAATSTVLDAVPTISTPQISGTAQEGQMLSASASSGQSDNPVTYQWLENSGPGGSYQAISGATGSSYQVKESDEGFKIEVVATATNGNNVTVSATSIATGAVLDAAPTITTPIITGMAQEGQTLTASAGSGQSDNPVTYQWLENNDPGGSYQAISGATGSSYQVKEGDEGFKIEVVATATNENNVTTSKTSDPTGTVTDAAPTITNPTITSNDAAGNSTVREGDILTASATARDDDAVTYQWFSSADGYNTAISSGATYAVREVDEGFTIKVVATSTNDNNISVSATSAATAAVRDSAPTISVPIIGGLVQDGQTITASATPGESEDSVSFAWYSSKDGYTSAIGTGPTYLLGEHDEGFTIEAKATVTNDNGETASAFSAPTVSVAENPNEALQITVAGAGNGYVLEGQQLVAIASDPDDPPGFVYTWQTSPDNGANNDWVTVQSGPSEAYTPTEADENKYLQEISVFTDDSGNTETGTKNLGLVVPVSEPPSVSVPGSLSVNEGGTIQLPISITAYDADDDQLGSTVTIAGLPADATLSAGTQNRDGSWTVQVSDLPNLSVTVGAETAGSFQITVSATATDITPPGSPILAVSATGQNTFVLSILPEQPSLAGTATSVTVDENGTAGLPINIAGVDPDDVLSVTVSGLPPGASLSDGTLNPDGSWTLTPDQLSNLRITVGEEATANLTITASNSEGGLVATVTQSIALNIGEVPPTGSVTVSGAAKEGQVLTATASSDDPDVSFTYQWRSSADGGTNWNPINGATGQIYTVQEADENELIDVVATAHDAGTADVSITSAATVAVVDNSSITVAAISALNGVVQGQQLSASATITGDGDDAGATISYQWQVSGDGGTTWSNTGPATSGAASNVPASFYQLTEADEGKLVRAVASFTDDSGQVVSAASAPTVAVAEIAPVITVPFSYAVDELTIVKNGTQMFDDTFASAPPFATPVTDPAGSAPVNFATLGSTWSDVNSKAIMASGGAALIGGGAQVIARFNTNTQPQGTGSGQSELGLKQDAAFTVSGKFDLSAPSPVNAFYGIDLTDGSPNKNPADQVVQLVLKKTSTTGGGTYAVQLIQNNQATNTVNILAQQDITAQMAGNTQIEFDLSHAANGTAITGSFELFNNGTQTAATTFTPTGTIFINGVTYTRAEILAFAPQAATISGLAQEGQTLTANAATNDADAVLHYQWQSSTNSAFTSGTITNIGTDSKTYTLQESDEGSFIRVRVSSTDADGTTSGTVTSAATPGVLDQPTVISNLLVNGVSAGLQPREGDTLTATATVSEPAETVMHYQWQESSDVTFSNPNAITNIGTDSASYTVQEGDEGQSIRVIVTATDADNGNASTQAISNPSLMTLDPLPSLSVSVSGTAKEGATLTATPTVGTDTDGGNAVTYQWQSSIDGVSWNNIANATGSTYTVQETDEGAELRVAASFVDDSGQQANAVSSATVAVVDNSSITVAAISALNGVVQGQQLSASATITGDGDDAGATISYQWQVSGDGGTTWSNTGPATSGSASNVPASFYQLTEADEGKLVRAVASFTDDSGQVVSAASAPTVAVAEIAPVITVPFSYAVDELTIVKNGTQMFDDTFASAPPFATPVTDPAGSAPVNFATLGSTWSDVNSKAIMASAGAALIGGGAQVIARFNTNTQPQGTGSGQSELGLKQDAAFTVSGKFDLSAPSPVNAFYGIDLTDGSPNKNPADQVVQLVLKKTSTTGGGTYAVQLIQNNQATNTVNILAQQDITAQMAGNTQIEFDLSHAANGTAITGAFELFNNGTQTAATTFTPTGTIFINGVTYTRAEILAFAPQAATISGLAQEGQTLTANAATNDADAVLHYQWQFSTNGGGTWTAIAGAADSKTYTLQESDEGHQIRVAVNSTDADGNTSATLTSGATSGVTDAPTTISNLSVNGVSAGLQPREGDTLTATATVSEPAETVMHYQWQESSDVTFSNPNAITNIGIDSASYTVQEGDEGQSIRVIVTATDADNGNASVQAISNASLLTLDNSSITVAAISALNGVVQGQQLSASATITGDGDDAGATISYQWQVSGDGGTTWSNTGPATSGSASNVPASFYQLTEADEGKLVRAVASFTDDSGQVVSAASAPTVAVAEIAPVITVPFSYAVDELTIVKNGTQMFDDTFASAPPFATPVTDPAGSAPVNFATLGSTWSDVNSKAIMASGGAALIGGGAQVIARFNTNTQPQGTGSGQSELGLKQDAAFTVSGKFDLSAPSPVNAFYGIDLTDGSPSKNPADQVVQLVLKKTSTTGGGTYAVQLIQNNQATNTVNILAQQDITAQMAGNTQIEFDLSHAANGTAITGSFELFNNGTQTAATTFTPTGTIFINGVTYTRAEILAFEPQTATISGLAQEGQTLTANAATNDADATLHYQWQSSPDNSTWTAIAGSADAKTYTLQEGDEGSFIRVRVNTGDGDASQSATVFSGATAKVADAPPSINVSVSGDAQPGVLLAANAAVSTDADGGTSVQYQWQSSTDGSTWNNIAGANAQTYTVANTDLGSELRVQASFSDDTGQHASAASAATAAVKDGTITVADGATVEIGGANVSSAVQFEGSTGTLQLDYPTSFTGTVAGFGAQDQMDLIGFDPSTTTLGYSANADNTGGTLTATDASHSANIALLGNYVASSFAAASDGHGGVVITDPPPLQNPLLSQPHA